MLESVLLLVEDDGEILTAGSSESVCVKDVIEMESQGNIELNEGDVVGVYKLVKVLVVQPGTITLVGKNK